MSFPNRDTQILAHILEYCNRIEKTLSRFGREFDVFLDCLLYTSDAADD